MDITAQHLTLLRAAAQRPDGLLLCPDKLVGTVRRRMADRLCAAGVAEAVPAEDGQPHWLGTAGDAPTALRITAAGRDLVAGEAGQEPRSAMREELAAGGGAKRQEPAEAAGAPAAEAADQGRAHRPGTKRALLIDLLGRPGGATLAVLTGATGWQPHTVRAALTRLRQDGVTIDRVPGEAGSAYRIDDDLAPGASADAGADA